MKTKPLLAVLQIIFGLLGGLLMASNLVAGLIAALTSVVCMGFYAVLTELEAE